MRVSLHTADCSVQHYIVSSTRRNLDSIEYTWNKIVTTAADNWVIMKLEKAFEQM